uniref:Gem (nuclear organelle) associated protein 4 n=1 Tax=Callorhinchus milii TaxID=7868 RepID=A0A4W3ILP5_CALMI|eukprot:gi/632965507/ref/XP_007898926.1/ PREDICTED: gem-associated protein 4 [Callorhinchus milii]
MSVDLGTWVCCEKVAVLHGGFLLAERQSQPKTLSEMQKSDWAAFGQPILDAVHEVCTGEAGARWGPSESKLWEKKVIAFLWAKLFNSNVSAKGTPDFDAEGDRRWKEDLFFSVESMIPSLNYTVLFELLKALRASETFVELLSVLPADTRYSEVNRLVEHVLDRTSDQDVAFFLDIWWELMKHSEGQRDEIVQAFGSEIAKYLARASDECYHSSKRLKLDPSISHSSSENSPGSPCDLSIPSLLLDGLKRMKPYIAPYILKCLALAKLSDTLCKSVLYDNRVELPAEAYLQKLTKLLVLGDPTIPKCPVTESFVRRVKEAEKELRAFYRISNFKLPQGLLAYGLETLADLLYSWSTEVQSELERERDIQQCSLDLYRTVESLTRLSETFQMLQDSETVSEGEKKTWSELQQSLTGFVQRVNSLVLLDDAARHQVEFPLAVTTIEGRMERYTEICEIFASNANWAFCEDGWLNCLERNRDVFQSTDLVLRLVTVLMAKSCHIANPTKAPKTRLKNVILSCFSALSISDKNKVISGVLSSYGSQGLCKEEGAIKDGFQKELNMAFNCITQSETVNSIDKAVTAIARVALLNPEATLEKACHLAVVNLGAHKLLGQILKKLPALSFVDNLLSAQPNILAKCLLETGWGNLSTPKEENQFLELLTSLMEPGEILGDQTPTVPLLQPSEAIKIFVLPHLMEKYFNVDLALKVLNGALQIPVTDDGAKEHWIVTCCPFPLIFALSQLLDSCVSCWEAEEDDSEAPDHISIETKGLLVEAIECVCDAVGQVVSTRPESWSTSICWLYQKTELLDWCVRLRLKSIFGGHFKYEVPATLFEVCDLSDDGWSPLHLPQYGPGTGLLAWMECCCISTHMMEQMLSHLTVNVNNIDELNMFSKGFLVALIEVLPWCSSSEWKRLNHVVRSLLQRELLHVPYTLEYVHHMPLLNLRPFAHHLQFSQLLLRAFQLICSCSCADWLPTAGWKHVVRQCAGSMSDILESVKCKVKAHGTQNHDASQEAVFVIMQLFCHLLHIMVMTPSGTSDSLYFVSLELLSQYETLALASTSTTGLLNKVNEKHFLQTIAENLPDEEQRSTLLQKISKL